MQKYSGTILKNERKIDMIVFTCCDTFDDMMTCIYDAWATRLGHSNIRLQTEPIGNFELFCEYRHIDADKEKVKKVIRSIQNKICPQAFYDVYAASLSYESNKLDIIYRFLIVGFLYQKQVIQMLGNPAVAALFELKRKVTNEAHQFREFVRFSRFNENILLSVIEPKCNVLTLLAPHFEDRMPSENWMIIDKNRMIALIHPLDQKSFLSPLTKEELSFLENSRQDTDLYSELWKTFFHSVAIKERKNARCQRNLMPLWFRKNMTEFP